MAPKTWDTSASGSDMPWSSLSLLTKWPGRANGQEWRGRGQGSNFWQSHPTYPEENSEGCSSGSVCKCGNMFSPLIPAILSRKMMVNQNVNMKTHQSQGVSKFNPKFTPIFLLKSPFFSPRESRFRRSRPPPQARRLTFFPRRSDMLWVQTLLPKRYPKVAG